MKTIARKNNDNLKKINEEINDIIIYLSDYFLIKY